MEDRQKTILVTAAMKVAADRGHQITETEALALLSDKFYGQAFSWSPNQTSLSELQTKQLETALWGEP